MDENQGQCNSGNENDNTCLTRKFYIIRKKKLIYNGRGVIAYVFFGVLKVKTSFGSLMHKHSWIASYNLIIIRPIILIAYEIVNKIRVFSFKSAVLPISRF